MAARVLLTGANRGIGLAMAGVLLQRGYRLLATCRSPERAPELMRLVRDAGNRAEVLPLDVSDGHQVDQVAAHLDGEPLDYLINNAGVMGPTDADPLAVPEAAWLETLRINCIAPTRLAARLRPSLRRSERPVVATITSKMGSIADNTSGGYYAYRSSKAAVNMAMRSLSVDFRPDGIIVVVLHPGWVRTDMGGESAPLMPQDSATRLVAQLEALDGVASGGFFDLDGNAVPW